MAATALYMTYLGSIDNVKNNHKLIMDKAILTYSTTATPQQVATVNLKFSEVNTKAEYDQLLKDLGGNP